jgi:hypothetical protein
VSAAVAAGFLAGAVAFPVAQERVSDVTIRHIELDGGSRPLPVLNPLPAQSAAMHDGGVYEVYFNNPLYVPGLGPRQKLFITVVSIAPDGWYSVVFGDEVENKGQTNARVVPVLTPDMEPAAALNWRLYYTSIAAVSPNLAVGGIEGFPLQHWPE